EDARVEACREKARAAGFELRVSLEAVIGFVSRTQQPGVLARTTVPAAVPQQKAAAVPVQRRQFEISANDRRFLRSLRIAADETQEKEVEYPEGLKHTNRRPPGLTGRPFLRHEPPADGFARRPPRAHAALARHRHDALPAQPRLLLRSVRRLRR